MDNFWWEKPSYVFHAFLCLHFQDQDPNTHTLEFRLDETKINGGK